MAKAVLAANGVSSYKNDDHHRWIDLVFLGRQTMGQKSLEIEILKLFKSQLEIHLAQLAHMEDESQLRVRLHTIKGAAFGVGANEVAQLAAKAEKELLSNGHVQPGGMDRLRQAVRQTSDFISHLLET
ncbi:Hpt domain-containing protein [Maritalea porphyrae]|jgi:HPt (histidine-containing phosphotransfer) domain-containing protein|uniref:Hpt domain-containing protein n=1 Tax=Maritalea porphyrae TaxID=880732 RepID=UPI0022B02EE8|nr:Hpt domain-containing protein [Maritalea porphyrae]MCZ4272660.1 Hpt domain-containing protein [Maritalea porphyrae]